MDAIVAAMAAGATDDQLKEARDFHRKASMRYDFVMSENSTGFHSPQEAAACAGERDRHGPPGADRCRKVDGHRPEVARHLLQVGRPEAIGSAHFYFLS